VTSNIVIERKEDQTRMPSPTAPSVTVAADF
jgi:hypothetical protein